MLIPDNKDYLSLLDFYNSLSPRTATHYITGLFCRKLETITIYLYISQLLLQQIVSSHYKYNEHFATNCISLEESKSSNESATNCANWPVRNLREHNHQYNWLGRYPSINQLCILAWSKLRERNQMYILT